MFRPASASDSFVMKGWFIPAPAPCAKTNNVSAVSSVMNSPLMVPTDADTSMLTFFVFILQNRKRFPRMQITLPPSPPLFPIPYSLFLIAYLTIPYPTIP
jgi:hypothetical protein